MLKNPGLPECAVRFSYPRQGPDRVDFRHEDRLLTATPRPIGAMYRCNLPGRQRYRVVHLCEQKAALPALANRLGFLHVRRVFPERLSRCVGPPCIQRDGVLSRTNLSFISETASLTYHACDMPQPEMSLIPLIVVTAIVEIAFFTIRVWVMRKKGHSRGFDDITISIAFVSCSRKTADSPTV